ncbi:unnamed protein product [Boreogadus saida]
MAGELAAACNQSRQLLASHRRKEESLGVYAADVQLLTRHGYPEFPAQRTADLEPQYRRQLGLVEDCGWTGQHATHPCPSRRRGRRKARRRRAAEDGVPERRSRGPLQRNLVGAPMEVVPDHNPRTSTDCWRQASQPGRKCATTGPNTQDCALGVGVVVTSDP